MKKSVVRLSEDACRSWRWVFELWRDFYSTPYWEKFTSLLLQTLTSSNTLGPDQYGLRVFEGVMAYKVKENAGQETMKIFRLTDHIERFFASAQKLWTHIAHTEKDIREAMLRSAQQHLYADAVYLRPTAWSDYKNFSIDPSKTPFTEILVEAQPFSYLAQWLDVWIFWERLSSQAFEITAKISGNYANSAKGKVRANQNGYNEALFLKDDYVTELSGANVFFIKENNVITPPKDNIFAWLTRDCVFKILEREKGIHVRERPIHKDEITNFDAAFWCWSAAEIKAINSINGVQLNTSDPLLTFTKNTYKNITQGKIGMLQWHEFYQDSVYRSRLENE